MGKYVRQEFPNDVINMPFDPAAQALLTRFPIPTKLTASANNYTRTANDDDHQNQFDVRVDGAFGSRDRSFGRYSYYNEVEQPVTPLPDGSGADHRRRDWNGRSGGPVECAGAAGGLQ